MMVRYICAGLGWLVICPGTLDYAQSQGNPGDGGPHMAEAYDATGRTAKTRLGTRAVDLGHVEVAIAGSVASRLNDGAADAPICKVQHPFLLDRYQLRPDWRVAGVDYCVGYPVNATFKDPATISMPGVAVNTANKTITVTGSNATLDGYDFSLNGGWGITVAAANTRIENSKFVIGSNNHPAPIWSTSAASNLYVGYCVIDGNNSDNGFGGLLIWNGAGLTVEYSWIKNAGGDSVQVSSGGEVTLRYNLIEQAGQVAGAHGDFLQSIGGPFVASILFNTTVQTSGFTQGFMLEPDIGTLLGVITSGEYGYNTMIARGDTTMNYFIGVTVADIVKTVTVHDNYFDAGGAYGFAPGGIRGGPNDSTPKTIFVNNVNMVTNAIVQDANPTPRMRRP